uniref:Uncharacterized protein n=1 Tax=Lepeophtheirus salmonis TaxID=72036 RepID=A0A0K2UWA9_LEPSM
MGNAGSRVLFESPNTNQAGLSPSDLLYFSIPVVMNEMKPVIRFIEDLLHGFDDSLCIHVGLGQYGMQAPA